MNKFDPLEHSYVEHHTYTGPDCAICGKVSVLHPTFINSNGKPEPNPAYQDPQK